MKEILVKTLGKVYNLLKSNTYFNSLYYSVANSNYFTSFLEHEKMLADKSRMDTYHEAITRYVNKDDIVIDLGTGTGILSFFAAKKSPRKIYAIDHGKIIESAKKIAVHNKISNIEFVNANSRSFSIKEKADIIIHEQIGALLFDEHMIENILDLRDRLLKKGGKILPGKYEVFLAPVKLKDNSQVPYIWEQEMYGVNYDCFDDLKTNIDAQYGILKVRPETIDYFLGEPVKFLSFDMEKMKAEDIPKDIKINTTINRAGRCDGFCFYFNIIFDDNIILSTDPINSSTHWNIPIFRCPTMNYEKNKHVSFSLSWKNPSEVNSYKWEVLNR
ncbi:MAG: methyltransferase domain-containing protein [Bacteroidota bacterium]|nr:methyltransferase domain-containing protein [Bacteroidota bacterium]